MDVGLGSMSICRGDGAVVKLGAGEGALTGGGGSIEDCDIGALVSMTGSGSGSRSASFPVSMVISFVLTVVCR